MPGLLQVPSRYDILDAIRRTLRSLVNGTSPNTYSLGIVAGASTQQQRVQLGSFTCPPIPISGTVAFVAVADGGTTAEAGPTLLSHQQTGQFLLTGWCLGGLEADQRLQAAARLEQDIKRALLRNPQLKTAANTSGTVHRFVLTSETFDGKDLIEAGQHHDLKRMGVVLMTLTATWQDRVTDLANPAEVV